MKSLALAAIRGYQRYVSPYKGFRCAYCFYTGRASCSALGYRVIQRYGVLRGVAVLQARLYRCGVAYRRHSSQGRAIRSQRGDCDFGCVDLPFDCDALSSSKSGRAGCNVMSGCCDVASCDWPNNADKRKKRRKDEEIIHLPDQKQPSSRKQR